MPGQMEFVQMEFVQNFPCFSIMLCMFAGIISSAFKEKIARLLNIIVLVVNIVLSAAVLLYTVRTGESYVYVMGRFPAPWGNELRVGMLETGLALFFCAIMLFVCWAEGINWCRKWRKESRGFIMYWRI